MKKFLIALICFCMAVQLTACSIPMGSVQDSTATSSEPLPSSSDETTAPEDTTTAAPETVVPQAPMVAVSLPVTTESATASDGTVIFNYTFQNISLIVPDADVADMVIVDFLNRIDTTRDTAEEIHTLAKSAYTGQDGWNPYLCMISYAPMRIDAGVLSLFGTQAGYYGSPHPETVYSAVNYDLVTGEVLTLGDILDEGEFIEPLCQLVLEVLAEQEEALYLYDGYEETVSSHFSGSGLQSSWYFSPNGLCFYFTPYEIAPYSSGVVAAEIPYEKLAGIMNDAYFPAEQDTAYGTVEVQLFTQSDLESYSRFAEVVLDTEGEKVLLHTDHMVQNVRIEYGTWSSTGSFFTPQYTVFAAASLVAGDAFMVEALLSDTAPTLRLQYETGGQAVSVFIAKENDGGVALIGE